MFIMSSQQSSKHIFQDLFLCSHQNPIPLIPLPPPGGAKSTSRRPSEGVPAKKLKRTRCRKVFAEKVQSLGG